jgi:cyclase
MLDISREKKYRNIFTDIVNKFAKECFVPLSVGGGIRNIDDAKIYLDKGADRVVLNSGALIDNKLVSDLAKKYGSQCVIASIDAKKNKDNFEVFSHSGVKNTKKMVIDWALQLEKLGAGEIMLNSIDLDGSLLGYDLRLCKIVSSAVNIPVLICGGAGNWSHFSDAIKIGGADAVCTTNIYHFSETSIKSAKKFLSNQNILVRT